MSIKQINIPKNFPRLKQQPQDWWVEIQTIVPRCTYYFGPFDNLQSARLDLDGYLEDLVLEKAVGITVKIKKCQPLHLTIVEEN
ncbi:MAG: DUF1816 domain-containing protein [Prochloraceae cyanobacterium]